MRRLQIDYVDLYLIHQSIGDVYGAWRAMQDLYREGRAKAIGVSDFPPDRVMDFIANTAVVPAVDQIETHPFNPQVETQSFLQANGVQHESWAPFAEGKHEIFRNETLVGIAQKHQKTVAQIIPRWLIQRGIAAIPKSVRTRHRGYPEVGSQGAHRRDFDVFDVDLTTADMEAIASLDMGRSSFFEHRDPQMVKFLSEAARPT